MAQRGFKGQRGGQNPQQMMKQLQQLQERMAEAQRTMEEAVIEASAGGGAVKVEMSAKPRLMSVTLQPEIVDSGDMEMLQDLIIAAVNEALEKIRDAQAQQISSLTGGLNLPGLSP